MLPELLWINLIRLSRVKFFLCALFSIGDRRKSPLKARRSLFVFCLCLMKRAGVFFFFGVLLSMKVITCAWYADINTREEVQRREGEERIFFSEKGREQGRCLCSYPTFVGFITCSILMRGEVQFIDVIVAILSRMPVVCQHSGGAVCVCVCALEPFLASGEGGLDESKVRKVRNPRSLEKQGRGEEGERERGSQQRERERESKEERLTRWHWSEKYGSGDEKRGGEASATYYQDSPTASGAAEKLGKQEERRVCVCVCRCVCVSINTLFMCVGVFFLYIFFSLNSLFLKHDCLCRPVERDSTSTQIFNH